MLDKVDGTVGQTWTSDMLLVRRKQGDMRSAVKGHRAWTSIQRQRYPNQPRQANFNGIIKSSSGQYAYVGRHLLCIAGVEVL